jgi:penicillin G amidase
VAIPERPCEQGDLLLKSLGGGPLVRIVSLVLLYLISAASTCRFVYAADEPPTFKSRAEDSVSTIQGRLKVAGLEHPVHVLRDRWGVAHIYAQNQHDLFFAQGFVAAQDRLFQMELWKRSGQGRLAEVLGPTALFRDINARLLRYRGDMKSEYESYSPDTEEILEAFTGGINANIALRLVNGDSGLPIEFRMAGFRPEPWEPEDCLNRMAAFSMTGNARAELEHAEMVAAIGPERASRLLDLDPKVMLDPAPGIDFSALSPELLENLIGSDSRIKVPTYYVEGSNDWTVSGTLTQTGKPLLANDPHRVVSVPSLRYMVHLVAPGWDVIGAGEPALPGVALGHNQQIAWGFTVFGSDQQDLYLEDLNPNDRSQYRTDRGWEPMRVQREVFRVRGNSEVTVELKFTRHGPVLWQNDHQALALRWVGMEPGTAGYLASLAVDRAENWEQFSNAMKRWFVPSENIVYADRAGNIGEYSVGLSPVRKNWTGLLPVLGTGRYEWSGFIPISDLPHSYNPAIGFIATANNKMIPESYPYNIGFEWSRYRVERITQVLRAAANSGHKLTIEDCEHLQSDFVSLPARELIQLLERADEGHPSSEAELLLHWDGVLDKSSPAAALYEIFLEELTSAVVGKIAPPRLWFLAHSWSAHQVLGVLSHPSEDVFGAEPEKGRNQLIKQSLHSAVERLRKLEGHDSAKWTWGQLHYMQFRHSLSPTVPDLGPLPRSGDGETVGATGHYGDSFEQVAGASYREILDTNDWDNSLAVNTPGQSGEPGSRHYSDLLPLWNQGVYFPLIYSHDTVERVVTDRLELDP